MNPEFLLFRVSMQGCNFESRPFWGEKRTRAAVRSKDRGGWVGGELVEWGGMGSWGILFYPVDFYLKLMIINNSLNLR